MFNISEYTAKIDDLRNRCEKAHASAGITPQQNTLSGEEIHMVFAGEYSAGKSSIIKMLTGIEQIKTGAQITTETAESYHWRGIQIIDTPGIHTELRPDHDEITYKAIAAADMLVFVIINELFDSRLAEHLLKD